MLPAKLPAALVSVNVCAPRFTAPLPDRDWMDAPAVVAAMSKTPLSSTSAEAAMLPAPASARVAPALIAVAPVYVLVPSKLAVPPARVKPPVPLMLPAKLPEALVSLSVCAPRLTAPLPDRDWMDAPSAVAAMSKMPLSATPAEAAMRPAPASARVAPGLIVVVPV